MSTKERNENIAKFMGWFQEEGSETWFVKGKSAVYVAYSPSSHSCTDLPFHRDMNYLVKAIEILRSTIRHTSKTKDAKIGEYFIDELEMKMHSFYCRLIQWTADGWRMFDSKTENPDLSVYYIVGENCETWTEGFYLTVSTIINVISKK